MRMRCYGWCGRACPASLGTTGVQAGGLPGAISACMLTLLVFPVMHAGVLKVTVPKSEEHGPAVSQIKVE